jgi:MFS family permease
LPISAVDTVSLAFRHTKEQLFQPFRFGQWTRLAVVGLLAGELGSSGGCNTHSNFNVPHQPDTSRHFLEQTFPSIDPALLAGLIVVLVVAGLVLGIVLMYVSSVMRFILFDSVLAKECHIRQGWSRRQVPGVRFFVWHLLYTLVMIAGIVVLVGIPLGFAFVVGWLKEPRQHLAPLILGGILLFLLLAIFVVAASVAYVLTKDFVVPQMALENIDAFEGWRRLWRMLKAEKGGYAGYIGMKIVLAIGAAIIVGIATVILALIFAIPTVGLAIVAVLTGKTAGLTWNVYTITVAVVVGCILLAVFLYLVALISVPVIVFFPAYSIYFFAARYPALSAVLYPVPAGASPISAPAQPPPLPPTPEPIG